MASPLDDICAGLSGMVPTRGGEVGWTEDGPWVDRSLYPPITWLEDARMTLRTVLCVCVTCAIHV